MRLEIDTAIDHSQQELRAAAAFLLSLSGDITLEALDAARVPTGTPKPPEVPRPPRAPVERPSDPTPPTAPSSEPWPPAPPPAAESNVLPFPTPPAPAVVAAAPAAASTLIAPTAGESVLAPTAGATAAVPAEYDSAGMPWDARIHQKAKSKKKDGTWKLQKGIDMNLVQSVTAELAKAKLVAAAPNAAIAAALAATPTVSAPVPPPPAAVTAAVPLPPSGNTLPLLPQSNGAADNGVPVPPPPASVPVPPVAAVGGVPSPSEVIVKRCVDATVAKKLTPVEVRDLLLRHGCPGLQMLSQMPDLVPAISAELDIILAAKG